MSETTLLALSGDVLWSGIGAAVVTVALTVPVTVLLSVRTARRETERVIEEREAQREIRAEGKREEGLAILSREFPAMADRARKYASNRYRDAVADRKHENLQRDAHREAARALVMMEPTTCRGALSEVITCFDDYAALFNRCLPLDEEDAKRSLTVAATALWTYVTTAIPIICEMARDPGSRRELPDRPRLMQ